MPTTKTIAKADTVKNRDGKPALHMRSYHDIEEHVTRFIHDMRPESTAAVSPGYYRQESMPPKPTNGGHDMSGGSTPSTGGNNVGIGTIGIIAGVLFVLWLLSYTPLWPGNWHGGSAAGFAPTTSFGGGPGPRSVVGVRTTIACPDGYSPRGGRCEMIYDAPRNFQKAQCVPGEKREVPDPSRPGYTITQTCGYRQ